MKRKNIFLIFALMFSSFFPSLYAAKETKSSYPKWELAIATMFRDEACYLKEWIEFHKLVGVEHFYLYNHLSTDNYLEVLEPYIKSGEVELFDWKYDIGETHSWRSIQETAFHDAIKRSKNKVCWLAIMDTDEFLFTRDGKRIQDHLRPILDDEKYAQVGGLKLKWWMFGTSHVEKIPAGNTLIETLTMSKGHLSSVGKTICRPERTRKPSSAYNNFYFEGYAAIEIGETSFGKNLQLNHYWTRDEDFFKNVKLDRKKMMGMTQGATLKRAEGLNRVQDTAILRYVPALREKLGLSPKAQPIGKNATTTK